MQPSVRFLLDAQLPPLLAIQMTSVGYPAIHLHEQLAMTAPDADVAQLANALGAAVMSKDADFVDLVDRDILKTALVWIRCGNVDPTRLWAIVQPELANVVSAIAAGQRIVEVR